MQASRRQFLGRAGMAMAAPLPVVNAAAFGAAGDGTTDDTAALQRAIDEGAGVLELPPGTFRITEPLVLDTTKQGYVGVRGAQGASRIVMAGPGPALRIVGDHQDTADPKSVQPHTWEQERFPIVTGFEILGAHEEADGIALYRTMQCVVSNVLIRECRYGIHLIERNRNVLIADSHIYNGHDSGIFMDNVNLHQINIIGNHISYCKRAGIRQLNGDVHNVQITGNDIEYNYGFDGMSGEILLEAPDSGLISEYTISSNTIQAKPFAQGANVVVLGRPDDYTVGHFAITGNVLGSRDVNVLMENVRRSATIVGNTIYTGVQANVILRGCRNVVVSSNTIAASRNDTPERLDQGGVVLAECTDCTVAGNIMESLRWGTPNMGGAVTCVECARVSVSGCHIQDPHHRGIHLQECRQCRVSDNSITRTNPATPLRAGVEVEAGTGNLVQNNAVVAGKSGAVVCTEGASAEQGNLVLKTTI
ncbi:MAG: hypothetical protein GY851_10680 [bacterium]|nr:hypothetical protein [bacterium]